MDQDDSIIVYERSLDDVNSMIKHAKLNAKNLTTITQSLYYPLEEHEGNDFKLLEINSHLMAAIEKGENLYFKGGLNEKLVLCTDDKTFDVKEAEISNSLLIVPDLKSAQATSTSPLKSPKSNVNNRSLDSSVEENADDEMLLESSRKLEKRIVLKIVHEYFECREINPRFRKLGDLLQLTRYSGPENEYCIDKNLLFRFDQLLDTIQSSRNEFLNGLRQYRAIEINGRYRVLEYQYEYRVVSLMMGVLNENSWPLDGVDKNETLDALNDIIPEEVLDGIFDIYTIPSAKRPNKYQYSEKLVCRIVANNILQGGMKFHINDFMTTWQEALPDGMHINEKYLQGIGIIDRRSNTQQCVRSLVETTLSTNLLERLKILFSTIDKWTLDEIEPYIQYFATPQLTVTSILAKHARSLTENGQRVYVAKHL